jgi:hypothetical protein
MQAGVYLIRCSLRNICDIGTQFGFYMTESPFFSGKYIASHPHDPARSDSAPYLLL